MLIQPPQCLAPSLQIIRSIDLIYEGGLPATVESVVVPSEFAVVAVDIPVVAVVVPVVAVVLPVVVPVVVDEHGEEVHEDDGEGDEQTPNVKGEGEVELLSHLHFPLELRPRSGSKMLQDNVNKVVDVKMWFWNTKTQIQ